MRVEVPLLDPSRCIGCGECVEICPVSCLEMKGPQPWLVRPADCISCANCVLVCPTDALKMAEVELA